MVSRGVNFTIRNAPPHPLFVACPPSPPPSYDDFKTFPHLFATPSPINMTTMKRHHAVSSYPQSPLGKPLRHASPQAKLTPHLSLDIPTSTF